MRAGACLGGALLVLAATPALAQDCEQYRRAAETARRNSNTGIRNNDEAQRQAAGNYERLYNHCRQRSGGGGGVATPGVPTMPQYTPPPLIDNSGTYNNMANRARSQSQGMDMSMPGRTPTTAASTPPPAQPSSGEIRRFEPKPGTSLAQFLERFQAASGSSNPCLRDLGAAGEFLVRNAETCRVDGQSLKSDIDLSRVAEDANVGSHPGWRRHAGGVWPDCHVQQMRVQSQQDAFAECLRVNMCGMFATQCAIERIQPTGGNCEAHVSACMAEHPIPQSMAQSPPRKPWPNTQPLRSVPGPAAVDRGRGTISGPSQGGGGSPSGATSAR